jgi:hypothetical protein
LHSWLTKRRPKDIQLNNELYRFKTKGKLKLASIDKRFELLSGFFSYLKEKKLIDDVPF